MDDVEFLTRMLPGITSYPEGIRHVEPGRIDGPAFFPGGTGIFDGLIPARAPPGRSLPRGGVLVLGHNFHDVESYEASVRAEGEVERTPMDTHSGHRDPAFREHCIALLRETMKLHTCLPGEMTPMACVVVTHPCLGPSNRRHRSLDRHTGVAAEIVMVRRAALVAVSQ